MNGAAADDLYTLTDGSSMSSLPAMAPWDGSSLPLPTLPELAADDDDLAALDAALAALDAAAGPFSPTAMPLAAFWA